MRFNRIRIKGGWLLKRLVLGKSPNTGAVRRLNRPPIGVGRSIYETRDNDGRSWTYGTNDMHNHEGLT